jgi:mevalonate kinase
LRYFAPGKLLLSGEYAVLDGAKAISCPSHQGQFLELHKTQNPSTIEWQALTEDAYCWLNIVLTTHGEILETNDLPKAELIRALLLDAFNQNIPGGLRVECQLDFKREWGLGSSSTLITLLAAWANKDAMELFFRHLTGSGYDVATALEKRTICYQLIAPKQAKWEAVQLPSIVKKTYFLYLGEKQISSTEVLRYDRLEKQPALVNAITQLSDALLSIQSDVELIDWMAEHERITGLLIQQESHRNRRFPKLQGGFKSLGAWGGDFVWIMPLANDLAYLKGLGYTEIFPFEQMLSFKNNAPNGD